MKKSYSGLFVLGSGLFLFLIPLFFGAKFGTGFWVMAIPISIIGIIILLNDREDKIDQIIKRV